MALLEALQPDARDNHYGILLREEMEQADLERARHLYDLWGAEAKIRQLEEKHADLLEKTD